MTHVMLMITNVVFAHTPHNIWLRPQCMRLPDFHGKSLEFPKHFYLMTPFDLQGVSVPSVPSFIKVGTEEIENERKIFLHPT